MEVRSFFYVCSVLAKIHMVTKLRYINAGSISSSVLAKIHMVTKRWHRNL